MIQCVGNLEQEDLGWCGVLRAGSLIDSGRGRGSHLLNFCIPGGGLVVRGGLLSGVG